MKNLSLSIFYRENKFKRYLNLIFNKFINRSTQYGPDVVFLNLTNGLKKMNIKFFINPEYDRTFQHCIVLNDPAALKKLINLKKNYNFKIYAGPNLMILSNEYDKILYKPEINKIIVPSKWIKKKYIEVSDNLIKNKIIIWGSGVDHEKWLPGKEKKYDFLIYSKHIRNKDILQKCIKYLIKNNFTYKLLKYGSYGETNFRKYLSQSKKSIFFSESESQGIAYFESWSANIPTLVYNPMSRYRQNLKIKSHSCPFLNNNLGTDFKNYKQFERKIHKFWNDKKYQPRKWIKKNYTLVKAANNLLNKLNIEYNQ